MITNALKLAVSGALLLMTAGLGPTPAMGRQSPLACAFWPPSPCISSRLERGRQLKAASGLMSIARVLGEIPIGESGRENNQSNNPNSNK